MTVLMKNGSCDDDTCFQSLRISAVHICLASCDTITSGA